MPLEHTALGFQPKRQWKPKKKDRDPQRRRKRKIWYRKNKSKIRQRQKKRYKALRNNPTYKRWQAKKRKETTRRKFRQATQELCPKPGIPEIWFVLSGYPGSPDIDLGYVVDLDPEEDEFTIFDQDTQEEIVIEVGDFLEYAEFLEPEDWTNVLSLMDQAYEGLDEDPMDTTTLAKRVAHAHLTKQAFNKENPSDLLNQLVKLLDKASKAAEGKGKKALTDAASRVKGIAKPVTEAWMIRGEE